MEWREFGVELLESGYWCGDSVVAINFSADPPLDLDHSSAAGLDNLQIQHEDGEGTVQT